MSAFLLLAIATTTGCKKDVFKDYSTLVKSSASVNILGVPSSIVVREDTIPDEDGKSTIIAIQVSLSEGQISEVHLPIVQIAGDATPDEDYEITDENNNPISELVWEPYTTAPQTFLIRIIDDYIPEPSETFKLSIGDQTVANANITPVTMDVTITNATDVYLDMEFYWEKDYLLHYWSSVPGKEDTTINTKNAVDMDFYVFDTLGGDMGLYDAATGSHPERLSFSTNELPEGVYFITASVYTNFYRLLGYGALSLSQGSFPVTSYIGRKGILDFKELVQDDDLAFNTDTPDTENDGAFELQDLFKVEVSADKFVVYKLNGSEFATARKKHRSVNWMKKIGTLPAIYRAK